MAKTMKAAVVRAFGQSLAIEEAPIPAPGAGEVLVKIVATGVCHTDLHSADGIGRSSPPHNLFSATRVPALSRRSARA
jgi:D-arabinose 1-dehydrogenase-like Zn-dependent alcohol dehydrogenase